MDENKENRLQSLLPNLQPSATSTAVKKNVTKKVLGEAGALNFDASVSNASSLLSGFSCITDEDNLSKMLEKQRHLAEQSLNRVSGIPSKYLRPNNVGGDSSISSILSSSTISESDLLTTPRNRSTPKQSLADYSDVNRLSIGHAMTELSKKLTTTDISIENFMKEFEQSIGERSSMFKPAEKAQSQLLADELSWHRKHDLPVKDDSFISVNASNIQDKMSVTDFFKQKSNDLTDLAVASPKRAKPVPLIPVQQSQNYTELPEEIPTKEGAETYVNDLNKTPSITQIVGLLGQSHTPNRILNMLLNTNEQDKSSSDESELALPLSKNSSYSSNYSENNVIREIVNEPSIKMKTDSVPSRTSSCLTSLDNGKLPLEVTKSELGWGCLKVGKGETKDFLVRNKSPKTVRIQLKITGQNYKIRKDSHNDSDPLTSAKLLLHGNESRQIFISFIPTVIGMACEELLFESLDFMQSKKQSIKLNGYGGFISVEMDAQPKDVSGKYWLNFGKIDNNLLEKKIVVKNSGNISAFCYYQYTKRHLTTFSNITIKPNFFTLIPNEIKEITITYEPTVNDHKSLQVTKTSAIEIGTIKMIYGAEANRVRLRRLVRKSKEANIPVDPLGEALSEKIKGEVMPADAYKMKDSIQSLSTIIQFFKHNDIIATVEQDPEQTLMPQLHDESDLFTTLCADNTVIENSVYQKDFSKLEPAVIILSPPFKCEDSLFLTSESSKVLHYEAQSNPPGLEIHPKEGRLQPKETAVLSVKYSKCLSQKQSYKIIVYVDSAVLETEVKVFYINSKN